MLMVKEDATLKHLKSVIAKNTNRKNVAKGIDFSCFDMGFEEKTNAFHMRLPWPPSVNTLYAVWNGRKVLSAYGKRYKGALQFFIKRHIDYETAKQLFNGNKIGLSIHLVPPDQRKRDADNVIKALFDTLTESEIIADDSDIVAYSVRKYSVDKSNNSGSVMIYFKNMMFADRCFLKEVDIQLS